MRHQDMTHAHGGPPLSGVLRATAEDFRVIEELGYQADGEGEHVLLRVRKRGLTSQQVADRLARFAGVRPVAVGVAGMKDRHALTEQAFSVQLPGREAPDWAALRCDDLEVLDHARHGRKLKRGALQGNRFVITLRQVQGDREGGEAVLAAIAAQGVPNYFGAQRFGRRGDNVAQARAMFAGRRVRRHERGILLSAARSHIFNAVLDARVRSGHWNRGLDGDLYALAGSRSWFGPEADSEALRRRVLEADIHPTGPLWGEGSSPAGGAAAELENAVAAEHPELCQGLAKARMRHDRRALRVLPRDLAWRWLDDRALELRFALPAGSYATTVIGELATTQQPH